MNFKIAVVQFEIAQFNPSHNLYKAERFIKTASRKADVIVFPEDFITGPLLGKKEYVDSSRRYLQFFQELALMYKIDIVSGSFIEGDTTGSYNTSYYIDRLGKIKGKYQKINLWHPERKYLTSGNQISVFNTRFGKAGLIICWDLAFPEIFRKMIARGVKIVYCPSFWCKQDAGVGMGYNCNSEIKFVNALCTARAFENEIALVYVNAAGKLKIHKINDDLIGQSQITVPFTGAIKCLGHNKEEMFITEINTDILKDAERSYKIREDAKNRILF